MTQAQKLTIEAGKSATVSALLIKPHGARACYVFAHGAGAGMTHAFMTDAAEGLAARGVATLRYQFPYMEKGGKRPDPPAVAQAAVRAAVIEAAQPVRPAADRGWQILWRAHDLAGAGKGAARRRRRPRLLRLSAACGRKTIQRTRRSSRDVRVPDAVPAGQRRQARRARLARAGREQARRPRDAASGRRRRSFLPRAEALGAQRPRGDGEMLDAFAAWTAAMQIELHRFLQIDRTRLASALPAGSCNGPAANESFGEVGMLEVGKERGCRS